MFSLENEFLKVDFYDKGAELRGIFDKVRNEPLMWDGTPEIWNGVSPILFPVVGRLWEFKYHYDHVEYPMGIHGFLRDQTFVTHQTDSANISFVFASTPETYTVYPFNHQVEVSYVLEEQSLHVNWNVKNLDTKEMYYSIGAHPAFLTHDNDEYLIHFEGPSKITTYQNNNGYIETSSTIDLPTYTLNNELFKDDALMFDRATAITLENKTRNSAIRVDFPNFDYVAIWGKYYPGKRAPFMCIEPWIGFPDNVGGGNDLRQKIGIKSLNQNCEHHYTYTITLQNK